jgi:hypothetical protein
MEYRNAKYITGGRIDCEIKHPTLGWIPYTLDPADTDLTVDNTDLLDAMTTAGDVAAYTEPTEAEIAAELAFTRSAMHLSFPQLLIGLVTEAWITEAEGDAWLTGTLPAAVDALIATLPVGIRFAARARAIRPSEVVRTDTIVLALADAQDKSPEEMDAFFTTYAAV